MVSGGIRLLNYYYLRYTKPSSLLYKSTGPIFPFVVLALLQSLSFEKVFLLLEEGGCLVKLVAAKVILQRMLFFTYSYFFYNNV